MSEVLNFLQSIEHQGMTARNRACALLWFIGREDTTNGMSSAEICRIIEDSGQPGQNATRLNAQLTSYRGAVKIPKTNNWRLHPNTRVTLDELYKNAVLKPRNLKASDSVVPKALFIGTRGYIEKVAYQINASYDIGLYDCCAVMCRRLLETLIIEVYEHESRANVIKDSDGNFFMFSGLLTTLLEDTEFHLSRNTKKGLEDFKRLGDLSAHSRRYNAQQNDIDRIQAGLRVSTEELLHLAKLL